MNTIRIEFADKTRRDEVLAILNGLDYPKLWESEPGSENVRALAGEKVPGMRVPNGRVSIVFRCQEIPQWVGALTAAVAHHAGVRGQDHPWAELHVDNELVLVAATSEDVRGTRGLLEVDKQGRLFAWRDRGQLTQGPQAIVQRQAVDQFIQAFLAGRGKSKSPAKPRKTRVKVSEQA